MNYFKSLAQTLALTAALACGGEQKKASLVFPSPSEASSGPGQCVWRFLQEKNEAVSVSFGGYFFSAAVSDANNDQKNDLHYIVSPKDRALVTIVSSISFFDYYPLDSLDAVQYLLPNGGDKWLIVTRDCLNAYNLLSEAFKRHICEGSEFLNDKQYEEFQNNYQRILTQ